MTALAITACIIWCVCSVKSNRQKDGFHRLRQHRDEYEDEIRLTSMGSKKSLLSHEFQDESESDEDTLYANKLWYLSHLQHSRPTLPPYWSLWDRQKIKVYRVSVRPAEGAMLTGPSAQTAMKSIPGCTLLA